MAGPPRVVKGYHSRVKIATWNVNGIRARAAQLCEWLQRDRPDIVCLQELKATTAQIPAECRLADYHLYCHTRKPNAVGQRPEERALFETLLDSQLVDLGRQFDPDNPNLFTWWAPWRNLRARNIGWRLDYFLTSPRVAARATSCAVLADVGTSDHAPVVMTTR